MAARRPTSQRDTTQALTNRRESGQRDSAGRATAAREPNQRDTGQRDTGQRDAGRRGAIPAPRTAREATSTPVADLPTTTASPTTIDLDASFTDLGVPARLVELLTAAGITAPFPIQSATLPDSLAGRDVLGRGRTGSGKTLAFVLPVLTRLATNPRPTQPRRPRALILAPTRELANQIHATITPMANRLSLRTATVYGGVGANPQISALRGGLDVLVACPGRLADHMAAGHAILDAVEITVLDEADHMADLGFLPVVKRLLDQTPKNGQRLLFSATLDGGIDALVRRYLQDPVTHSVDSAQSPVSAMIHHVLHIDAAHRLPVLIDLAAAPGRTIMFTRTKHGAKKLAKQLAAARIPAVELHGNLAQNARTRNLAAFSDGRATTLVATDIAARGIHVDDVTLVVHADPPVEHKAYLHRSGRTARAGAAGTVVTLMTDEQRTEVRELTRKAGITATTTRLGPGDRLLTQLAPGERTFATEEAIAAMTAVETPARSRAPRRTEPAAASRNRTESAPASRSRGAIKQGGNGALGAKQSGSAGGGRKNGAVNAANPPRTDKQAGALDRGRQTGSGSGSGRSGAVVRSEAGTGRPKRVGQGGAGTSGGTTRTWRG